MLQELKEDLEEILTLKYRLKHFEQSDIRMFKEYFAYEQLAYEQRQRERDVEYVIDGFKNKYQDVMLINHRQTPVRHTLIWAEWGQVRWDEFTKEEQVLIMDLIFGGQHVYKVDRSTGRFDPVGPRFNVMANIYPGRTSFEFPISWSRCPSCSVVLRTRSQDEEPLRGGQTSQIRNEYCDWVEKACGFIND